MIKLSKMEGTPDYRTGVPSPIFSEEGIAMREMKITAEQYARMKAVDVRTVDPAAVPDIRTIRVDTALPPEQRILEVVRQMNGNPFLYRCGNILVKTSFAGTQPLQSVLEDCLEHSK